MNRVNKYIVTVQVCGIKIYLTVVFLNHLFKLTYSLYKKNSMVTIMQTMDKHIFWFPYHHTYRAIKDRNIPVPVNQ